MRKRDLKKFNINENEIPDIKERIKNSYEFKNRKVISEEAPSKKRINFFNRSWAPAILGVGVVILVCVISLISTTISESRRNSYTTDMSLNYVSSKSNLKEIVNYSKSREKNNSAGWFSLFGASFKAMEDAASPVDAPNSIDSENGGEYSEEYAISETNKQVENVDEADVVKCDGNRVYRVSGQYIYVNDINSGNIGETVKIKLKENNKSFINPEIYLTDLYLVVLFSDGWYYSSSTINVNIYDVETLELVKTYQSKSRSLNTSRLVMGNEPILYLIFNQYLVEDGSSYELPNEEIDGKEVEYDYSDICYFNTLRNNCYTVIVSIKLGEEININSQVQLGDGYWDAVYMTESSIYLARVHYDYSSRYITFDVFEGYDGYDTVSVIVKYTINNGEITPIGNIRTAGQVINQFAMSEYNGYFRVALSQINNNKVEVYRQDKDGEEYKFKLVGKVDKDLGEKNEVIKSVTFNKDICLVVTAKNTDPMYKIDLSDPTLPVIMGKFKEDGYNSYLQYLKGDLEGYAIGLGYMTEDISEYYNIRKGAKFGLYDVTGDNPVQLQLIEYADVYPEACENHKALFIYKNYVGFNTNQQNKYVLYSIDKTIDGEGNESAVINVKLEYAIDYESRLYFVNDYFYLASASRLVSFDSDYQKVNEVIDDYGYDYEDWYDYQLMD